MPSTTSPRAVGRPWRRIQAKLLRSATTCWLCGGELDKAAPVRSRYAPSIDHVIPRSKGGSILDPANLRVAHYGCNSARGNRPPKRPMPRSQAW